MADTTTAKMAANEKQIRVITEDPDPLKCADKLWNFFSIGQASPIDFFPSRYNSLTNSKKMIIFQFLNKETRDKALSLDNFQQNLANCKFQLPTINNQDSDHRTIFVNRLPACFFYFFFNKTPLK